MGHGSSRIAFLLTIGLVCGWGVFQMAELSFNVPWMDEAVYTVAGLDHEWFKWIGGLIYPPVAGLGAWGAMFLGLEPIVGARFMSVLFGMGTAILIDRIAGLLAPYLTRDESTASWLPPMAVLLFSLSGSLLFIGRYAAYDGMCYFFVALSFYSFLRGILRKERLSLHVAALAVVASFATKYITAIYGMFPLPAVLSVTMWVVYKRRRKNDALWPSIWGDEDARRLVKHFVLPLMLLGGTFLLLFWDFVQEGRSQVLNGVLPFGFQGGASEILVTSVKILLPVLPLAVVGVFVSRKRQVAALLATLAMVPVIYHLYFGHVTSIGKVLALSYLPGLLLLAAAPLAWMAARMASAGRWERLGLAVLLTVVVVSTSFHAAAFLHRYQGWRNTRRSFESMRSFVRPTDRVLSYHIKYTAALMLRLPASQVDERWDGNHLERVRQGAYDSILLTNEQRRNDVKQENGERSDQFIVLKEALRSGHYEVAFWEFPNLPDNPVYYGKADTAATRKLNQEPTPEELDFARNDPLIRQYFGGQDKPPPARDIAQGVFVLRKRP
jgi:hypothetical protein